MPTQLDAPTEQWTWTRPPTAVAPRALAPGCLLADRYTIEAALGQGGMGVVYRAHDRQTDTRVAVKAFFPPPGLDEGARRFQREFRALTRLQHPRIVRVSDYGDSDGVPFYVMEFIAGADLAALRRARGGRLSVHDHTTIATQLCDALAYMHAQGIVHRDLKRSNVMVENRSDQDQNPKSSPRADVARGITPNSNFQTSTFDEPLGFGIWGFLLRLLTSAAPNSVTHPRT